MTDLSAAAARSEAEGRPGAGALLAEQMSEAGDKRPRRRDVRPLARLIPYAMRHKGHALAAFFWLVAAAASSLSLTALARGQSIDRERGVSTDGRFLYLPIEQLIASDVWLGEAR